MQKAQALTAPKPVEAAAAAEAETPAGDLDVGNTTECSNCEHPGAMHADTSGGDNMGACTAEGCSCSAMEAAAASAEAEDGRHAVTVTLRAGEPYAATVDGTPGLFTPVTIGQSSCPEVSFAIGEPAHDPVDFALAAEEAALPAELAPGETLPDRAPALEAPVSEQPTRQREAQWTAIFAPEGKLTSDRRAFAPGAIRWRNLPLTLMGLTVTEPEGHEGAELCGRIDNIWRDEAAQLPDTMALIRAAGVFDTGEYGQEIARLVGDRTLTGNSVDLAIHEFEYGPRSNWFAQDDAGNWVWAPKPEEERSNPNPIDLLFGDGEQSADDPAIYVITDAEIGMSTVCPFPAFEDATIEIANSLAAGGSPAVWTVRLQGAWTVTFRDPPLVAGGQQEEMPALTAAGTGAAPLEPPAEWFDDPQLDGPTPLMIDDDGRIYGHAAVWEIDGQPACHTAFPGVCVSPPESPSGYAYFHLGEIVCEGGERISCGKLTLDAPHANIRLGRADATAHYDHTGTVAGHVRSGEDEHGIWVAGAVDPQLSAEKLRIFRGSSLSGDWRDVQGHRELIALLCVNVPGFPVPRTPRALVASTDAGPRVLSLISAGVVQKPAQGLTDAEVAAAFEALRRRARGAPSPEAQLRALAERARAA